MHHGCPCRARSIFQQTVAAVASGELRKKGLVLLGLLQNRRRFCTPATSVEWDSSRWDSSDGWR
ncbi:hypothetical protein GN958_ATG17953 [Phytophthora infestans]|uniref:Uncharacterized protein n=1 Tax=Phytophthora infestans TaxID=4787 RepID=A0A8S9TVQ6_PHYIN|nr:hypothetical protein GN958_ATG17953 [Phytophthora infestans]